MKIYVKAYLSENLGDDVFLKILTERYSNHKFYAISNGFKGYNKRFKNLKVISNHYFFKIIRKYKLEKFLANRCDLTLTIGGSMFMEENVNDKNKEFSFGKNKHYIIGSNFGPYKTRRVF